MVSALHAILMRFAFLASLMTAAHRQRAWPSLVRIYVSIVCQTNPGPLPLCFPPWLCWRRVSVQRDPADPVDVIVRMLLGRLFGGDAATFAYEDAGLEPYRVFERLWIVSVELGHLCLEASDFSHDSLYLGLVIMVGRRRTRWRHFRQRNCCGFSFSTNRLGNLTSDKQHFLNHHASAVAGYLVRIFAFPAVVPPIA